MVAKYGSVEIFNMESLLRSQSNIFVNILVSLFGIGAWISVNGLWVELPLLVTKLPEGWSLPSYISVVIQMANIGPLIYSILRLYRGSHLNTVLMIYVLLMIGFLASFLIIFYWDKTVEINENEYSLWLLVFLFFLALVDCTSSVLYIPYMASWKSIYLSPYLVGEGLSGFLPAVVALGQGIGSNEDCMNITNDGGTTWILVPEPLTPNFSVTTFFIFLFGMMILSTASFITLENYPYISSERSLSVNSNNALTQNPTESSDTVLDNYTTYARNDNAKFFFNFLYLIFWTCFLVNGFLPSIQSYSCAPYGSQVYHFAVVLSSLANPTAALSTMKLPRASPRQIKIISFLGTCLACYIFATAVMNPSPPLVQYLSGSIIIVITWIVCVGLITYVRVEISNLVREEGEKSLFWIGVATQVGSAIGALLAFSLVNYTNIFTQYQSCL